MTLLESREREALTLRFVEEWEYHQIAAAKAIPIGTVQWRVFSAKKKLAARLRASSKSSLPVGRDRYPMIVDRMWSGKGAKEGRVGIRPLEHFRFRTMREAVRGWGFRFTMLAIKAATRRRPVELERAKAAGVPAGAHLDTRRDSGCPLPRARSRDQKYSFSANCRDRGSVWIFVIRPNEQPAC